MTNGRELPPPLLFRGPDCSICDRPTDWWDVSWHCDACGARWPVRSVVAEPGEWDDPDAQQCRFASRPSAQSVARSAEFGVEAATYRCLLADGHTGDHEHPDYWLAQPWSAVD